jgi:hypothetical protein
MSTFVKRVEIGAQGPGERMSYLSPVLRFKFCLLKEETLAVKGITMKGCCLKSMGRRLRSLPSRQSFAPQLLHSRIQRFILPNMPNTHNSLNSGPIIIMNSVKKRIRKHYRFTESFLVPYRFSFLGLTP